ncbi:MAG: hypothetical protein ABMA13_11680 [Chthoniobacteraceae bacterium]
MTTESIRQQPSGFRTFFWALFYFFVFALVVVIWVRGAGPKGGYEDKRAAERTKIREQASNDAKAKLTSTTLVDKEKGIVHVPIADAKKSVLAELKAKKVGASAVKVDAWLPMPPPADPNATEPPPPALSSAPQGADTVRFETAQPATK